jgi:deoxyuridine 5'-triphosphate nucleotidohydrolase
LDVSPGKKSDRIGFPRIDEERLAWAFLRGLFDGDGSITSIDAALKRSEWPIPRCSLVSRSQRLLDAVLGFCGIPAYRGVDVLEWSGSNALDFLGKLYVGSSLHLARKRDLYLDWCCWAPVRPGPKNQGSFPLFRWARTHADAVPPSKRLVSDSGFDLVLIAKAHAHGAVQFFRTGIRIQPAFGWYFDLVPRSSISKTGYMLANGVGVIDRGYTGEVLVPLIKVDASAPDLELPARLVQIIPRPIITAEIVEVDSFDETSRGAAGFGSSGR